MASKEEKELASLNETGKKARETSVDLESAFRAADGPTEEVVRYLSAEKDEPEWMLDFRLDALKKFLEKPMHTWGPSLEEINFDNISYYVKPLDQPENTRTWDDVPEEMKRTYDRLGVPRAEAEALAGVANQWDSEVVFHNLQKELEEQGVVFLDMDSGLREHEEVVRKYFGSLVPSNDNKFAALNSAFWSGGSFVYIPEGVEVDRPLQTYFRINSDAMLQAERTLIIAEKGARVSYFEGCIPAGEKISTGDRMVNIESVHPGDTVCDQNGEPARVKQTMARDYSGDIYEIQADTRANSFQITPEHPILIVPREKVEHTPPKKPFPGATRSYPEISGKKFNQAEPEFREAKDVRRGDFLVFPKIRSAKEKFSKDFSDDVLKIFGYYLVFGVPANGFQGKEVRFEFTRSASGSAKKLLRCLRREFGKDLEYRHDKERDIVTVFSEEVHDTCLKHCGEGANQELSKEIMELPDHELKKMIKVIRKSASTYWFRLPVLMFRIKTHSEIFTYQLQELFSRQDIYTIVQEQHTKKDNRTQYVISHSPDALYQKVRQDADNIYIPVRGVVKKHYEGVVFNLDCESPNSYLVKGFAVHNCSAQAYSAVDSVHAAVVELIAHPDSEINYFTAQNWDPRNVWNMVTKRARAEERATVRWVQGELGSRTNLKFPSIYLMGEGAHGEILSVAFAGKGQNQDTGGKAIHVAPNTTSQIISKSISSDGGVASYRGLLEVAKGAYNARSRVVCDALILDDRSASNTWPTIRIGEPTADIGHEATVSKVGEEQLFYLMAHGISEAEAQAVIVNGFIESVVKEMPMEYAVEINRLIELQMEGSIG